MTRDRTTSCNVTVLSDYSMATKGSAIRSYRKQVHKGVTMARLYYVQNFHGERGNLVTSKSLSEY